MKAILKHYNWYVGTDNNIEREREHAEILFEDDRKAVKQATRIIDRICKAHNLPRAVVQSDMIFSNSCIPQFGETTKVGHTEMRLVVEVLKVSGLIETHVVTVIFEREE